MKSVWVGDIEANGLLDTVTKIHCGVFKNINTGELISFIPGQIQEMIKFIDTTDVLIFHNGYGYDWPLLEKLYGYKYKGTKVDTLLMSRLLAPKRSVPLNCPNKHVGLHSVEAWGYRVGRGKPEHNDWAEFSEAMLHRCKEDVEIQHLIYNKLMKEAHGYNWKEGFKLTFKLFELLQKQEQYGWRVDRGYMDFCIHQLDHWIHRIDRVLDSYLPSVIDVLETKDKNGNFNYIRKPFLKSGEYSVSSRNWVDSLDDSWNRFVDIGGPFSRINIRKVDLNSNDETKAFLLAEGWQPAEWNYNDNGEKTSAKLSKDDPFEGINGRVGKIVARRIQCRHRKSTIEGLIQLIRGDGRISSIVTNLATTSRATHKNIVNIPQAESFYGKQMRKMFICKDGYVIVGTDSDACQVRMLCARMGDEQYTNTIINGKKEDGTDIHSVNMRAAKLPDRYVAKRFFYCFLFGGGDAKVGKVTGTNAESGKRFKEAFLKGLPALKGLIERLTEEWKQTAKKRFNAKWNRMEYYDGYITGLDGRPIFVPFEHQVLVYALQSDEAIMMSAAYCRAHQQLDKAGYIYGEDYGFVIFMHDEFNIECRKEIAEHVAKISEEAIEWAGRYYHINCPHKGEAKIGKDWYSVH